MKGNYLRITYVKLINHVVLGNKEFRVDNDIISILGRNGAGKSFLIDVLQPLSKSNRFIGSYPIKAGETGYKQINFTTIDGTVFETIHEYVPKGKSHSCKSYLNKIDGGVKIELNPTGHCDKFEELVKQYLNFDTNCMTVGFLSFKANGITSSKGQDRKKILETTIDNPILKLFKKNVKALATEHTAMAKMYEKRKVKIASQYTEESLTNDIEKMDRSILEKRIQLEKATKDYDIQQERLDNLNELENVNINALNDIYDLYKDINDNRTIYQYYQEYQDALKTSERLSNSILDCNNKLTSLSNLETLQTSLKQYMELLNEKTKGLSAIKEKVNKYVNIDKLSDDIKFINTLKSYGESITSLLTRITNIETVQKLREYLDKLRKGISEDSDFVGKYKAALNDSDGNVYSTPGADICNTCEAYDKIVRTGQFIKDYKERYNKLIDGDLEERKLTQYDGQRAISIIEDLSNNIMSQRYNYLRQPVIDKLKLDNIDTVVKHCINQDFIPVISNLSDWLEESKDSIELYENDIKDIESKIEMTNLNINLAKIDLIDDRANLEKYLNDAKNEMKTCDRILTNTLYKAIGALDISDKDIIKFATEFKSQIVDLHSRFNRINEDKIHCMSILRDLKKDIDNLPIQIESMVIEKTKTQATLNDLKNLNKNLVEYDRKRKLFLRCKDLIDKEIPISLLRNNLSFIEKTTNSILINNSIQMSVSIIPSDSEITIEVTVRDKVINDAIQLSAGETAIISLLLNSSILAIIGYPILCLDECDSFMDATNRIKYNDILESIRTVLGISQIFIISHNIDAMNNAYATKIKLLVGENGEDRNVVIE